MDNENNETVAIPQEIKPIALGFYRAKAALRINLVFPNFRPGERYPQTGGFMFTFAESASGDNKYDWRDGCISFFLSAAEVGGFVDAVERTEELKAYHDPDKGKPSEGTRAKSLALISSGQDYWLNVGMKEKRIGIKISPADQRQLALLLGHSLRLCYGWY